MIFRKGMGYGNVGDITFSSVLMKSIHVWHECTFRIAKNDNRMAKIPKKFGVLNLKHIV